MEYATPESLGPTALVRNEKAGEKIIEHALVKANKLWGGEGWLLKSYKTNLDSQEETAGSHESYLVKLGQPIEFNALLSSTLGLFLITRPLCSGNGHAREEKGKFTYYLSQRLLKMEHAVSGSSTNSRPIINTRPEPLADPTRFQRLHLIVGDALLLQAGLFLKYATTAKLVDAFFSNYFEKPPFGTIQPEALVAQCGQFANEKSLKEPVEVNERKVTAVDVQEEYRNLLRRFCESERDMTEEDKLTFSLWDRVIEAAKQPRPHEELARYVDWALKKCQIEQDMERRGYDWKTPHAWVARTTKNMKHWGKATYHLGELQAQFHENSPRGFARKFMDNPDSSAVRIVPEQQINEVMFTPPHNTRAYARHLEMQAARKLAQKITKKLVCTVDAATWSRVQVTDDKKAYTEYYDPDPFDPQPHQISPAPPPPETF